MIIENVFDKIKEGMLHAGVPSSFVSASMKPLDETTGKRVKLAVKLMETKPLIFVTGVDSPIKDTVCAQIMYQYMLAHNKNGLWLTPSTIPTSFTEERLKTRGITVILGLEILQVFQIKAVAQLLRDRLPHGAAFIISMGTDTAHEAIFGADLTDYLSHYAVMFNVKSERQEIAKV
jgi:hypothetical protein